MSNKPQTIQIFLPDGSPSSIREAEITNRLVKAILFPRSKVNEVARRDMVHYTGVYFLFGNSEEGLKPIVYIGEGEDCYKRIQAHNRNKDFWTHCVIITTKTDEYTKTDGKFLEHYCIQQAEKIGKYKLDNDTGSKKPSLSESREYDLLDNFETLKILIATLGYSIFDEKRSAKKAKEVFFCKGKKATAEGELIDEGFLVHKGSTCVKEATRNASSWVTGIRERLIKDGVLQDTGEFLTFQDDQDFKSLSAAAATVLGRQANGWTEWKNKSGKTLDELKRK